jgi:hypothetical protein
VQFAPEGDSFLSAVVNALSMFFFPVPPLDAHGNRAERARPKVAHFASNAGEFLFPFVTFGLGFLGAVGFFLPRANLALIPMLI